MSEEILKALIRLFAVISKQDGGVTDGERNYVIAFFRQQLGHDDIEQYIALYDTYTGYGKETATTSTGNDQQGLWGSQNSSPSFSAQNSKDSTTNQRFTGRTGSNDKQ